MLELTARDGGVAAVRPAALRIDKQQPMFKEGERTRVVCVCVCDVLGPNLHSHIDFFRDFRRVCIRVALDYPCGKDFE